MKTAVFIFTLYLIFIFVGESVAPKQSTVEEQKQQNFDALMEPFFPVSIVNMTQVNDVIAEIAKIRGVIGVTSDIKADGKKVYIWDKINTKIEETTNILTKIAALKSKNAFYSKSKEEEHNRNLNYYHFTLVFIKAYVDTHVPAKLGIFEVGGSKKASDFKVKNPALARKLSLFLLEEWLLYVIIECVKFANELEPFLLKNWSDPKKVVIKKEDLYISDEYEYETNLEKRFGREMDVKEIEFFRAPMTILNHLETIGRLQAVYANFIAKEHKNGRFSEEFEPLRINMLKIQNGEGLVKLSNGLYSSKYLVAAIRSRKEDSILNIAKLLREHHEDAEEEKKIEAEVENYLKLNKN